MIHTNTLFKTCVLSGVLFLTMGYTLADMCIPSLPTVTTTPPATTVIGSTFSMDMSFALPSAGNDIGYGPYIDLIIPVGTDGDDGITFLNATYLGVAVTPIIIVATQDVAYPHPFARMSDNTPVMINLLS